MRRSAPHSEPQLYLCGTGLHLRQLTLETLDVLRRCDVVFSDALDSAAAAFFRKQGLRFRDLRGPRAPGAGNPAHRRIQKKKVDRVFAELAKGRTCAVLHYGHPTYLCGLSKDLAERARREGRAYRVVCAVSSLDAVLAGLELSLLKSGVHINDVSCYSEPGLPPFYERDLDVRYPQLLLKAGYLAEGADGELRRLCRRLLKFYPPEHPVRILECENLSGASSESGDATVGELGRRLSAPNFFTTLYIPPLKVRADR